MKKFERGSVTVFLTLILIPTIIITAIFMDVSRIRLYSNQAIMAADNYAEGILTEYDNLLKELYGIFAISNDEKAQEAVKNLREYIKSSFNPSNKAINFGHLGGWLDKDVKGFMPYKSAEVNLETLDVKDANLASSEVLGTQIGDFMRYRVIKQIMDSEDKKSPIDMIDTAKNLKGDCQVLKEKKEFDKAVEEFAKHVRDYYFQLKELDTYKGYLIELNNKYQTAILEIKNIIDGDDYKDLLKKIEEEKNKEDSTSDENLPSASEEQESNGTQIIDTKSKIDELKKEIEEKFEKFINDWKYVYNDGNNSSSYPVTFNNYNRAADNLKKINDPKIKNAIKKVRSKAESLKAKMNAPGFKMTPEVKVALTDELNDSEKLFSHEKEFGTIVNKFSDKKEFNSSSAAISALMKKNLDELKTYYLTEKIDNILNDINYTKEEEPVLNKKAFNIKISEFERNYFINDPPCRELYDNLKEFEKKAENEKSKWEGKANEEKNKLLKLIGGQEPKIAEDIPKAFAINGEKGGFFDNINNLINDVFSIMDKIIGLKFDEIFNEAIIKAYTIDYDFNMFSDRVDVNKEYSEKNYNNDKHTKESLTGYDMGTLNYIYGAEIEYLLGGSKSSVSNLNSARNQIIVFRLLTNYVSTYTIKEVNSSIRTISTAFPPFSYALDPILRILAALAETYLDWQDLIKGEAVPILKMNLEDLKAYEKIKGWLKLVETKGKLNKTVDFTYKQFLMFMLYVFTRTDDLLKRTGDLICLNVNNAKNGGNPIPQKFKMGTAHTAVEASCDVYLDLLLLPDGFGGKSEYKDMRSYSKAVVSKATYENMKKLVDKKSSKYKFSIIRGY